MNIDVQIPTPIDPETKEIFLLDSTQIIHYWDEICEGLRSVPHYFDFLDLPTTLELAIKGLLQFWAISDGSIRLIIVSEIRESAVAKTFRIVTAFGNHLDEFLPHIESTFDRIAARLQCNRIEVVGRKGWERKLRAFRAEYCYTVLSRAVVPHREQ